MSAITCLGRLGPTAQIPITGLHLELLRNVHLLLSTTPIRSRPHASSDGSLFQCKYILIE